MRRYSQLTSVTAFMIALLVLPIATNLATGVVPGKVKPYLWLAWPAAVISAVVIAVAEARIRHALPTASSGAEDDDGARLQRAAEELAQTVRRQWAAEAEMRNLHRPQPLRLRWSSTGRPVSASPAAVLGNGVVGGRPLRLRLHGGIDDIVTAFNHLPKRRLVLLGAPGAGKTVLAILLTLGLLDHQREHGGPVPVLLSLSSWDPRAEHLHAWVVRRLTEDYPALANTKIFGPEAARRLVTDGHIVPILDGLDETPTALHTAAIDAIDRLGPDHPLVLTCRSAEYEAAVATGGTRLATAAVVELDPVGTPEVITFLSASGVAGDNRWAPVLTQLREDPDGPLAKALSSPLMTALARAVYTNPATDPIELIDPNRFTDRATIEDHLLDAFIPSVYTPYLPPPAADRAGASPPLYPPEVAHRWLAFLAGHLQRYQTRDLAWWQLHDALPAGTRWTIGLLLGVLSGVFAGLGVMIGSGLVNGFAAALAGGLAAGLVAVPPSHPRYVNLQMRGRLRLFGRKLGLGLTVGFNIMILTFLGVGLAVASGIGGGPVEVLKAASAVGLGLGVPLGITLWLNTPADAIRSPRPLFLLRDDRAVVAVRILVECFGTGLLSGFLYSRLVGQFSLLGHVMPMFACGLGCGFAVGLVVRFLDRARFGLTASAWCWFLITRSWFALRGQLPWRLMRFLNNAHQRGVLRQTGAVYQFRHARLQDRLAAPAPASIPKASPATAPTA